MENPKINLYNMDCMEYMANCKDKQFDLAIVDPPYGIGEDVDKIRNYNSKSCKDWQKRKPKEYLKKEWDKKRPNKDYFQELIRISNKQIIWGANYMSDLLPVSGGWIVWDKQVVMPTFSDGELAWTNCNNSVKFARFLWAGYRKCEITNRFHPTQKPVSLYSWILQHYAKKGDSIFDSHLGSGSIALACHDLGFDLEACELDKDYFEAAKNRLEQHQKQLLLFRQEA